MAEMYLGLTVSGAAALPHFRWSKGGAPNFEINYSPQVEKAVMLDGSTRFNFKSKHPRRWPLESEMLTSAELSALITLRQNNSSLWFQNNWEDATWREVVISEFSYSPNLRSGSSPCRYAVTMVLEEVRR